MIMDGALLAGVVIWAHFVLVWSSFDHCRYHSAHLSSQKGLSLKGHIFAEFRGVSVIYCANLCFLQNQKKCRSFNYDVKDHICELNSRNGKRDSVTLASASGFMLYQPDWFRLEFFDGYGSSHCLDNGPCGKSLNFLNATCYEIHEDHQTYDGALIVCDRKYGRLAVLENIQKRDFIASGLSSVGKSDGYYIGLEDLHKDGKWVWLDKSPMPWQDPRWRNDHPDNFGGIEWCGAIERDADGRFLFNDVPCNLQWPFICEYDPWVYQNW